MSLKSLAAAATAFFFMAGPALADWSASADSLGQNAVGQTGTVQCPPGGTPGAIWGTGTYTSDSSICGAAQHFGWIAPGAGASVSYRMVPGQQSYSGSTQNGITTQSFGSWPLSFQITGSTPIGGVGPQLIDWSTTLDQLGVAGQAGSTHTYFCPPGGNASSAIWGTDLYSSDSAVCTAAQHRGLINAATGGQVTVLVLGSQPGFAATSRNGVTSLQFGEWPRSYTFQ